MPSVRCAAALVLLLLFFGFSASASAQTHTLTVHTNGGTVRVVSGAVGACHFLSVDCLFYVNTGATVRLAAAPGRFSAGTGPAAACALSTCSFVMTADADVTATFTAGNGPTATLTTTRSGDGGGTVATDGARCTSNVCTVTYLKGSSVELLADAGASARFTGYSAGTGDASVCGGAATCRFTLNEDASVTGTFLALTSLTVTPLSAVGVPGGPAQMFTATGAYSGGVTGTIASASGRGAWATAPALPFRSDGLAAAALGGRVYAFGGNVNTVQSTSTNMLAAFDPGTQAWTNLAPMLVSRQRLGAATAGGLLYAIGGAETPSFGKLSQLASMERYDPDTNAWTMRASMSAPRWGLVAGTVNGIIYAAGGVGSAGSPVGTLEAYDPASDTWTQKAPMPTPRSFVTGGVVDGIFYVVGGSDGTAPVLTVEAYNPATNTWTTRAPLPLLIPGASAAAADGVLYVFAGGFYGESAVYAYDPVADAWTAKGPMGFPRSSVGAASLNGIVYAIGGFNDLMLFCCGRSIDAVETFVDSLRWSSSAPAVARIDQTGAATPIAPGKATIVANVGGTTCGSSCPTFTVLPPTTLSLDLPSSNTVISASSTFTVGGWALNRGATTGTGVDAVHVYAATANGPAIFLGAAAYGGARPDLGAVFGSQFTNSGFTLTAGPLAAGTYTIVAFAHNALTGAFDATARATITVRAPVSTPAIAIDTPTANQTVTSAFEVGGWALDAGAPTGTGVDAVALYVFPNDGAAPGVYIGQGSYGWTRADVGTVFGTRFTKSGYHFTITGLGPGHYLVAVIAHSTVTACYSIVDTVHVTVSAMALMSIDAPGAETTITAPTFEVGGWSIDRAVESTVLSGTGVDTLHVYAFPNPGSGDAPIFLGVATIGVARPDVGAAYGARYGDSGYALIVDRAAVGLAPGVYNIAVVSHSVVSGTFNNVAVIRVTLQ
jgi:N-acetylneuraminic acid mutarotase